MPITTRHADQPHAWAIEVDAGVKSDVKPAALGRGTRVDVSPFVYATPARLKFLKGDRTEAEAVRDVVRRLAMSRPDVAFTLSGEERSPLRFAAVLADSAGGLVRLGDVLGAEFRANAVEVAAQREEIGVEGFAALPTLTRANSLGQYLFVNGRPVRDKLLLGAVRAAYADYLPRDRHPLLALLVSLPPSEVDVNVHPAERAEVRFRNAGLVRALIVHALRRRTGARGNACFDDRRRGDDCGLSQLASARASRRGLARFSNAQGRCRCDIRAASWRLRRAIAIGISGRRSGSRPCRNDFDNNVVDGSENQSDDGALLDHPLGAARAQVHDTYIVAQTQDGLVVITDAPHERIVYEQLKEVIAKTGVPRQILLIPEIVELDEASARTPRRPRRRALALWLGH